MKIPVNQSFLRFCLICIFFCSSQSGFSQLSGNIQLAGQANHAGVKVTFSAQSITAISDSCYTSASGDYSINIAGGLYLVTLSCPGFQKLVLNNFVPMALSNSVVIPSTTLDPGNAMYVSGNVSGQWSNTNTYYVTGSLVVPFGSTLNIQAGTTVKFMGYYDLVAEGTILASGLPSQPIVFTSNNSNKKKNDWKQMEIRSGNSIINYCIVEYSRFGIFNENSTKINITNSTIRHQEIGGITTWDSEVNLISNEVYDYGTWGIYCDGAAGRGTVSCNHVYTNGYTSSYGMIIDGNYIFENNHVHNSGKALQLHKGVTGYFANNYFHDNTIGVWTDGFLGPSGAKFVNNTFLKNSYYGILCSSAASVSLTFINNIIDGSTTGFRHMGSLVCDHNIFFNNGFNFENTSLPGLGQVVNTNSNGDPIDSYFNIYADPEFVTGLLPTVVIGSPALNAGNVSYGSNIGANPDAVCFSGLLTGIGKVLQVKPNFTISPNPGSGVFEIDLQESSTIMVCNELGATILEQHLEKGKQFIDLSDKNVGMYFVYVKCGNQETRAKVIKQ